MFSLQIKSYKRYLVCDFLKYELILFVILAIIMFYWYIYRQNIIYQDWSCLCFIKVYIEYSFFIFPTQFLGEKVFLQHLCSGKPIAPKKTYLSTTGWKNSIFGNIQRFLKKNTKELNYYYGYYLNIIIFVLIVEQCDIL